MQIWAMVVLAILGFWVARVIYINVTKSNAATPIAYYIVFLVSVPILGILYLVGGFN